MIDAPIPVTLIAGYLGSGKTTLINRVLADADGRRLAVLVNDVGSINVDARLIVRHSGATIELTNGCVCCGIGDDFGSALAAVRTMRPAVDHVVVELSGVAEPERVAPWTHTPGFVLDAIIVLADVERIGGLLGDRYIGDTVAAQLAAADLVLCTKTDLVDDDGRFRALAAIRDRTTAPTIDAIQGSAGPSVVLGVIGRANSRRPPADSPAATLADRHASTTLAVPPGTMAELAALIEGLDESTVRVKGVVAVTDGTHPVEVQRVGRRTTLRVRPDLDFATTNPSVVVIRRSLGSAPVSDRPTITLRAASRDDIPLLDHWNTMPHVIAATTDDPHADTAFDGLEWNESFTLCEEYGPDVWQLLIAEADGRPIGMVQVIDPHLEPTGYWGEIEPGLRALDIWIGEADDLGRGYGTDMMNAALDACFSDPAVHAIVIDPLVTNTRAHRFYERLGFQPVGPRWFDDDHCLVYRLNRR